MSWRDREYHQSYDSESPTMSWRSMLPPRMTLILCVLHLVAWIAALSLPEALVRRLTLSDLASDPVAIVMHPLAATLSWKVTLALFVAWTLAARIEVRSGPRRVLQLYLLGNIVCGAAYWLLTRFGPDWAPSVLDFPAGALVAWLGESWRWREEPFFPLGRPMAGTTAMGATTAILVGIVLAVTRFQAAGWLAAAALAAGAPLLLDKLADARLPKRRRRVRPSIRRASEPSVTDDIDDILKKISQSGIDSLTPQERERLEAARRRL